MANRKLSDTMNLYENININTEFNKLIDDEQEAIDGYDKSLQIFKNKFSPEVYNHVEEVINHIIDEEKEHIKELAELMEVTNNEHV